MVIKAGLAVLVSFGLLSAMTLAFAVESVSLDGMQHASNRRIPSPIRVSGAKRQGEKSFAMGCAFEHPHVL